MVSIFKALFEEVVGSIAGVIFIVMIIFISMGIFLIGKDNRNRKSILKYFTLEIGILEVCDWFWFLYFFEEGQYINRGMNGVWVVMIFPLLLLIMNLLVVMINLLKTKKNHA
ncbi:hypothetical protein SAMN02745248_02460 [Hathewaya proteolytica DSM 3090]|uniref:Uncharacterized protein n=1 Tax=Hathewaya proteolytica DSM 3090 TaxID=1121331 RepID=A0A1M6S7J7_9CLOT|nr:hypothetical protein [Hathewaya proteolytica]SHK40497.1 hypothetical protein SAMN02745248_02460 [Hathewaya proteolytica DSM 3090]